MLRPKISFSEEQLQHLSMEFQSIRRYGQKLAFYDANFGVVPFSFPPFPTDLYSFFSIENIQEFESIFRIERFVQNTLEKVYKFQTKEYVFNIKPSNSNTAYFNDYVIVKFVGEIYEMGTIISNRLLLSVKEQWTYRELLESTENMLSYVKRNAKFEYDRSLKGQFMNVFYKGVVDYSASARQSGFGKRRKFIELYLYAQGFLFGRYMAELKKLSVSANFIKELIFRENKSDNDFSEKVLLLKELGIVETIRDKYGFLAKPELDRKIIELISLITGEKPNEIAMFLYKPAPEAQPSIRSPR